MGQIKFGYIETQVVFDTNLSNGSITNEHVIFIEDVQQIWTHGKYYNCESHDALNESILKLQEDLGLLDTEIDDLKVYIDSNKLTVDSTISDTSTNPVENKVVKSYIDSRLFVGTQEEYEAAWAAGEISVGALVIITDESPALNSSTSAVLGVAVLGQMVLGQN